MSRTRSSTSCAPMVPLGHFGDTGASVSWHSQNKSRTLIRSAKLNRDRTRYCGSSTNSSNGWPRCWRIMPPPRPRAKKPLDCLKRRVVRAQVRSQARVACFCTARRKAVLSFPGCSQRASAAMEFGESFEAFAKLPDGGVLPFAAAHSTPRTPRGALARPRSGSTAVSKYWDELPTTWRRDLCAHA